MIRFLLAAAHVVVDIDVDDLVDIDNDVDADSGAFFEPISDYFLSLFCRCLFLFLCFLLSFSYACQTGSTSYT